MKNPTQSQLEVLIIKIRREAKNSKEIVLVGLELCREHLQVMMCESGALHLQQHCRAGRDTGKGNEGSRHWLSSGQWDNRSEAPQRAPKSRWDRKGKQDDNFSACLLSVLFNALQLDKILRVQKIPNYSTSLEFLVTGYKNLVGAKNGVTQIWRRTGAHWRASTWRNTTCASQQMGGADGKKVWTCCHTLTLLLHSSITLKITVFLRRAGSSPRQDYALEQFLVPKAVTYLVLIFVMFYQANPFSKYGTGIMQILVTSQKLNRKYF